MITDQELLALLNTNGGAILDNIDPNHVEIHAFVKENFQERDISSDEEMKDKISLLLKSDKLKPKADIMKKFLDLAESQKSVEELDPRKISSELFGVRPAQYRPRHFALVTQILHLIKDEYPLYTTSAAEMFSFGPPLEAKIPVYRKFNAYLDFYTHMMTVYGNIIEGGELYSLLKVVQLKLKPSNPNISMHKRMDLLVRSGGELKKKGKLLKPRFKPRAPITQE